LSPNSKILSAIAEAMNECQVACFWLTVHNTETKMVKWALYNTDCLHSMHSTEKLWVSDLTDNA